MMDYRMYTGGVGAGENAVDKIKTELEKEGLKITKPLRWIGFEGSAGTKFTLNDQKTEMAIPQCGSFVTPYDGEEFMPIYSLKFKSSFSGNIYYIY